MERISIPIKYTIMMITVFVSIIIAGVVYFSKNHIRYKDELKVLVTREIKGTIIALKDERRGSYYIAIQCTEDTIKQHSLQIGWEIKEYHIQIGDSISKEANSNIMLFYKLKDSIYEKRCEYEIEM
jgi:predicted membrane protein